MIARPKIIVVTTEPDFWTPGAFRLFICHISEHKDYARALQRALTRFHVSSFVAHHDITPTLEWQNEIELALSTADALVALLTPGFHRSFWTDQEVGFAMGRGRLAVAVRLGESPYGFMAKLQAFQGDGRTQGEVAEQMFAAFVRNDRTKKEMAHAVVRGFEGSYSFANGKFNLGLLERLNYWEAAFGERIEHTIRGNNQLVDYVPSKARKVIEKWSRVG